MRLPLPATHFWSIFAIVVGLATAVGLSYQRTAITVTLQSDVSIVDTQNSALEGQLAVTYMGQPVTSVRGYQVAIRNVGTTSIAARDVDVPLTFRSKSSSTFLADEVKEAPEYSPASLTRAEDSLALDPLLLNPSDSVVFSFVTTAPTPDDLSVEGRIAGVYSIRLDDRGGQPQSARWEDIPLTVLVGVALASALMFAANLMVLAAPRLARGTEERPPYHRTYSLFAAQMAAFVIASQAFPVLLVLRQVPEVARWVWILSFAVLAVAGVIATVIVVLVERRANTNAGPSSADDPREAG